MKRGLAGLALVLAVLGAPAASLAAELETHGWWWQPQTGQGPALPRPPHVPAEGLAVGRGVSGPTAVSAVRFSVASSEAAASLSLAVAEVVPGSTVSLVACPATATWFGTQAGTWGTRPPSDCARGAAAGRPSPDGAAWNFDLSPIGGVTDVVIQPAPGEAGLFEISFDPPTAGSLITSPKGAATLEEPGGTEGGDEAPSFFYDPASADRSASFGFAPAPPALGSPSTEAPPTRELAEPPRRLVALPAAAPPAEADPRLLAILVLLATLAAGVVFLREPLRRPRLLGPLADAGFRPDEPVGERGLGRFRRARSGTPPSLR